MSSGLYPFAFKQGTSRWCTTAYNIRSPNSFFDTRTALNSELRESRSELRDCRMGSAGRSAASCEGKSDALEGRVEQ